MLMRKCHSGTTFDRLCKQFVCFMMYRVTSYHITWIQRSSYKGAFAIIPTGSLYNLTKSLTLYIVNVIIQTTRVQGKTNTQRCLYIFRQLRCRFHELLGVRNRSYLMHCFAYLLSSPIIPLAGLMFYLLKQQRSPPLWRKWRYHGPPGHDQYHHVCNGVTSYKSHHSRDVTMSLFQWRNQHLKPKIFSSVISQLEIFPLWT